MPDTVPTTEPDSPDVNAVGHAFRLEEYKAIVTGAQQAFQVLVAWFTFFFTFEMVALGWTIIPATQGKAILAKTGIICFAFVGLHLLAIIATGSFYFFVVRETRTKLCRLCQKSGITANNPLHYNLYTCSACLMALAFLISMGVWLMLMIP